VVAVADIVHLTFCFNDFRGKHFKRDGNVVAYKLADLARKLDRFYVLLCKLPFNAVKKKDFIVYFARVKENKKQNSISRIVWC
jgi:hypothetical protein